MEIAQPLWAAFCSSWLSSWGKKFFLISSHLLTMWKASLGLFDNFPVGARGCSKHSLSPQDKCFSPQPVWWISAELTPGYCSGFSIGDPKLDTGWQMQYHKCWGEGEDYSPQPTSCASANTAQETFATRTCCWLMPSLPSTSTIRSFSGELHLSLCYWRGFLLPRCRTLYLSLLNFIRFLLAHFVVLYTSLWNSALPQAY